MEWLTSNIDTSFPFEDHVAYDSVLTPIVDAVVSLREGQAVLKAFSTDTLNIHVVDQDGDDLVNDVATLVNYGAYDIYEIASASARVAIVVADGQSINFSGTAPFALVTHDYSSAGLTSFNGLTGDVRIVLNEDFTVARRGSDVVIGLTAPSERLSAPPNCDQLFSINGETSAGGSFWFRPDLCIRVDSPGMGRMRIRDICDPCCKCTEFYNDYKVLISVDDALEQDIAASVTAVSNYNELAGRLDKFGIQPCEDLPVPTDDSFSHGFDGGTNHCNSLLAMARAIPISYGVGLSVTIINGFNVPVDNVQVAVSSTLLMRPRGGQVVIPPSMGNTYTFGGFPGAFTLEANSGELPSKSSVVFTSEMFEQGNVGKDVDLFVEVTATKSDDLSTLTIPLRVALTDLPGGFNMASGPDQPAPTDGQ